MTPKPDFQKPGVRHVKSGFPRKAALAATLLFGANAQAAMFQGEALDTVANVMSWVVLFVVPAVCIAVFWLVHVLPEKIAERNHHPQTKAIHTLCLLSLFFGGLLWPLAWLWAYSKPVLYKMAYGTDKVVHGKEEESETPQNDEEVELAQLRKRTAELEARLADKLTASSGRT